MKKVSLNFAIGLFVLALTVSLTWAQRGGRLHYSTLFNPQTVGAVSGEVVRVDYPPAGSGTDYCTQVLLKTPQGIITAILAPKGFMEEKGLAIAAKDQVTVTGSVISIINKPFILATEVTGDRTMKLREASGRPVWAQGDDWHVR
ncbi:MAG: hypothetical protein QME75_00735 [Deltaproteobacteria bacterium]|nr:hypothetical protein [Deltaproteobacteria bacterium]